MFEEFLRNAAKYRTDESKKYSYGTAGFRELGSTLGPLIYRVGLIGVLRSLFFKGETIGIMITASHNPQEDNGIKIVDHHGEMLSHEWEKDVTCIVNAGNSLENLKKVIQDLVDKHKIDLNHKAVVAIAVDTRPSAGELSRIVTESIESCGATVKNFGMLTTPQLHYIVNATNQNGPDIPTEDGYYQKFGKAFASLMRDYNPRDLTIDGANGVGALKFKSFLPHLDGKIRAEIVNDGTTGILNLDAGADFVKTSQKFPPSIEPQRGKCYASFDGDADRLVYFYADDDKKFHLLDGDKLSTLVAGFLKDLVTEAGIDLDLGVVQTAYANGNSTKYLQETMKVPVKFAKTGVKYLHHVALSFDIGVYFEANGHGTVIFNEGGIKKISEKKNQLVSKQPKSEGELKQQKALEKIESVIELINQTVGDAMTDLLLIEYILAYKNWTLLEWDNCYHDFPNRLFKVKVKDRNVFETTDAERIVVKPEGLQAKINEIVSNFKDARSFVRPSGTEDVVRVYAEGVSEDDVKTVGSQVCRAVYDLAGGIGDRP